MNIVTCPNCKTRHDMDDRPDYWDGMRDNKFSHECQCGVEFTVEVEYEPNFFAEIDKYSFPPWFIGPHKERLKP